MTAIDLLLTLGAFRCKLKSLGKEQHGDQPDSQDNNHDTDGLVTQIEYREQRFDDLDD